MSKALALYLIVYVLPEADPPLMDLNRFPCPARVEQCRQFAIDHRTWLANELEILPLSLRDGYVAWDIDAKYCWYAWHVLSEAQNKEHRKKMRRSFLADLRDHIGQEAYNAGQMPPPGPVWWFRRP